MSGSRTLHRLSHPSAQPRKLLTLICGMLLLSNATSLSRVFPIFHRYLAASWTCSQPIGVRVEVALQQRIQVPSVRRGRVARSRHPLSHSPVDISVIPGLSLLKQYRNEYPARECARSQGRETILEEGSSMGKFKTSARDASHAPSSAFSVCTFPFGVPHSLLPPLHGLRNIPANDRRV